MMDFTHRSDATELMDTEPVTAEDFAACLADLAVVNVVTLARRPTLKFLHHATHGLPAGSRISVLDVGFGHGDMLRAIWRWCRARGFTADLRGVDLNPLSERAAKAATPPEMKIDFQTGDVFALTAERPADFIISSLVTHHMSDRQIVAFLQWMDARAERGWFVNDLHRHPMPYHLFRVMATLAGWHRFVRHDGPVSIARSFQRADWEELLDTAGIEADISWHFPFRYCVGALR